MAEYTHTRKWQKIHARKTEQKTERKMHDKEN